MPTKTKRLTPAKLEKLALELIEYLQQHDLFDMVHIYVNRKCFSDTRYDSMGTRHLSKYGAYYVKDNVNVKEMVEYSNPETITMTFDGILYDVINNGNGGVTGDLNRMFKKYGLYYEQGHPWDFSLYYDD